MPLGQVQRQVIVDHYGFNLTYAQKLTADLPRDKWAVQPAAHMNHAAWVIGHLAGTSDFVATLLDGKSPALPATWNGIYGQTSKPSADASIYADGATLISKLVASHDRLSKAFLAVNDAVLDQPASVERLRSRFGTNLSVAIFLMLNHESIHLGQLSAWRRVQGLGPVL